MDNTINWLVAVIAELVSYQMWRWKVERFCLENYGNF